MAPWRPLLLAITLGCSLDVLGVCTSGTSTIYTAPIVAFAVSPSGDAVYVAMRVSPYTEPALFSIQVREGATGTPRELYRTSDVSALDADDSAVYFAEGVEGRVLRVERNAGRVTELATYEPRLHLSVRVHDGFAYIVSHGAARDANGRVIRSAGIVRVPAVGGEAEPVVAWTGLIAPSIDFDGNGVYFALTDSNQVSTIHRYDEISRETRHLDSVTGLRAFAVDGEWLYEATVSDITRMSVTREARMHVATVQRVTDASATAFDTIDVDANRIVARQDKAATRGCADDILVQYTLHGDVQLLSPHGGPFVVRDDRVIHAPTTCPIVPPLPPYVIEEICLAGGKQRAVAFPR